jgi:hypothetical protein
MSSNPRKRQKHLERRAAKRKEKKHFQMKEQHAGLPERLSAASKYPVLDATLGASLEDQGMGWVLFSRSMPNGLVAAVLFLVDRYCLGVKNVIAQILPRVTYDNQIIRKMRSDLEALPAPPEEVRKFLEEAVAYARRLGFAPHPDYDRAMLLFGDIDSSRSGATFEFGKDGKPLYINGPNETPEQARRILATLNHSCGGPDGYHFTLMEGPGSPMSVPEVLQGGSLSLPFAGVDEDEDEDEDES